VRAYPSSLSCEISLLGRAERSGSVEAIAVVCKVGKAGKAVRSCGKLCEAALCGDGDDEAKLEARVKGGWRKRV
jgi:hypothetical protein